jgi:hypothetical protein
MSETKTKPPANLDDLAALHAQIGERLKGLKERADAKKDDAEELTPEQIGKMFDLLIERIPAEQRQDFLDLHLSGALIAEGGAGMDAATRRRRARRKDDDDRSGDDPDDPDHRPGDPKQTAADDADLSRADAVRLRHAAAARSERQNEEEREQAQADYDRVFFAIEGSRAPLPLAGERARSYRDRMLKQLRKYSADHKDIDIATIADPTLFALVDQRIRADALAVARDPAAMQAYFGAVSEGLREVIEEDPRTGRRISRFVGPVSATLAPFRLPPMRARFDQDILREAKRRG